MIPPSPWLSARMISVTYLIETISVTAQNTSEIDAVDARLVRAHGAVVDREDRLQRVQRARADVAEHDPERAERDRGHARAPRRAGLPDLLLRRARRVGRDLGGAGRPGAIRCDTRAAAASRARPRCGPPPRCAPRAPIRGACCASSESTWKTPAELFISTSTRIGRDSPSTIRTSSIAAADSEWMLARWLSSDARERPCSMSSASATRTIPASIVSGRPPLRWPMIACRTSEAMIVRSGSS